MRVAVCQLDCRAEHRGSALAALASHVERTGAELVVLPGMGHDLPPELDDVITEAIARTAARASVQA